MTDSILLKMVFVGRAGSTTISANLSSTILQVVQASFGENSEWPQYRFSTNGQTINPNLTLEEAGLTGGEEVRCMKYPKGRKPVIYLFSPNSVEATVTLSLIPEWTFSSIYPIVPICRPTPGSSVSKEEITWIVRVQPGGDLTELTTGLDVAYLFWEAQPGCVAPLSPPPSPVLEMAQEDRRGMFNPIEASLDDRNSVLIPVQQTATYLDKTLRQLGLHTEARTSFITYWLPSILKHENIALRFLSQISFEKSAPLTIEPPPDVVTRVFMIFQGVANEDLGKWLEASSDSILKNWAEVVGVDLSLASNPNLFRVLEWGGMEVTI